MYKTEIKTVKTDRFEMDYFVFGEGKKNFVMIPGISIEPVSKSADAVAAAYDMFGRDYTVYVFDRAKDIRRNHSIEEMAQDTAEAMKLAGIEDAYILGASQGGMILLCIARDHPELVNRGILASTAARVNGQGAEVLAQWRNIALSGDVEKINHEMFSKLYTPEYIETYKEIFAQLEKQGNEEELRKLASLCEACLGFDCLDGLDRIKRPMLVIGAENDAVFPAAEASREMAEKLGCELYIYERYGHAVYDEAPDYKDRIMAFFRKQEEKTVLRNDCDYIVSESIRHVLPDEAVKRALSGRIFSGGRLILVSVGKAAWTMADAAHDVLGGRIDAGIVITKHGYSKGPIGELNVREAGHPVPDADTFFATREALELTKDLKAEDTVLFLLSGGGSALFEAPEVSEEELQNITGQLLACGADIVEMNTVRKRLSKVKGGRFAQHCAPAQVYTIVLSDIIGDPLDMIASGPAYPDSSSCLEAVRIAEKYSLELSETAWECLKTETPKELSNVETVVTGSVRELCFAAADACRALGYEPLILTDCLDCEAREAGRFLAAVAKSHQNTDKPLAFLAGGETVVHLTGKGKGGRNQELALAAAEGIAGLENTAVFSVGSDGTDGPTDAAGGYADGETAAKLKAQGIDIYGVLRDNDAYNALKAADGLIITGGTGTNVNDVAVVLIK